MIIEQEYVKGDKTVSAVKFTLETVCDQRILEWIIWAFDDPGRSITVHNPMGEDVTFARSRS